MRAKRPGAKGNRGETTRIHSIRLPTSWIHYQGVCEWAINQEGRVDTFDFYSFDFVACNVDSSQNTMCPANDKVTQLSKKNKWIPITIKLVQLQKVYELDIL
jgi:hypothetical protein